MILEPLSPQDGEESNSQCQDHTPYCHCNDHLQVQLFLILKKKKKIRKFKDFIDNKITAKW